MSVNFGRSPTQMYRHLCSRYGVKGSAHSHYVSFTIRISVFERPWPRNLLASD